MTYSIGIDSGSTATKGVLLAGGVIQRRFLCPTPFRPADAIREAGTFSHKVWKRGHT